MGILIPENRMSEIEKRFTEWERNLSDGEKEKGEVKGKLLSKESRNEFFNIIGNESDILINPAIIDLQIQKEFAPENMTEELRDLNIKNITGITSEELRNAENLHARMIGNLSDSQFLKYMTLEVCIIEILRFSILFRNSENIKSFWNKIKILVDRSSTKDNSREEQVFRKSLGWFLYNHTKKNPFELIEGVHDENHPFIINFDTHKGFDGRKMFKHIYFKNSQDYMGLQIIDIIANSMYKSLNDLDNSNGMLDFYKKIMSHSPLGSNSNLGFFYFPSESQNSSPLRAKKYAVLQEIIASK